MKFGYEVGFEFEFSLGDFLDVFFLNVFLMSGSRHLDKLLNFEIGIEYPNVYSLFCLLLDRKEGRITLQFLY